MKLLLVIDGMHPRNGGPPMVVAGSALALKEQGIDVTVLTTDNAGDQDEVLLAWHSLSDAGINFEFCAPIGLRDFLPWSNAPTAIINKVATFDVIHFHCLWSPAIIRLAYIARKLGKPYLFSTHGVLDHRAMRSSNYKLIKKRVAVSLFRLVPLLRGASGVIFGSAAEAAHSWEIAPGMKKIFVPNGVLVDNADQPVTQKERDLLLRYVPEFDHWERSLLYFARIHPEKGADLLVQAFNIVAPEFPGAGLLIAGLKQDEVFQRKVEALIAKTPDPTRLRFTTELTGSKSQFLYRMCDCYVLSSHAEGFSVALTEALANGRPALITRFCHMPDVEQYAAGFIVEPTCDDLVAGLRKILGASAAELQKMGHNARNLYETKYTWSKVAKQLAKVYTDSIVQRSGAFNA